MSIGMILKVFSDCCICFAILGAFPSVLPYSYPLLLPALLCGTASGLATFLREKGRNALSRICAAIPLLSLLFAVGFRETIILFPVIVYTAVVILRGQLQLEYYSYRQFLLRSLMLLGALYLVLSALSSFENARNSTEQLIHAGITLRYGLVHLICGVILQRQLRLGMENRGQGGAGQMAAMLGGTGVVIGGFLAAEPLLRDGAATVFKTIVGAIFSVVMAGYHAVDQIEGDSIQREPPSFLQNTDANSAAPIGSAVSQMQQTLNQEEASSSLWWLVLVAAVLLVAMALMLLSFRKKSGTVRSAETAAAVNLPEKEIRQTRRSNRGKVRQLYREFLRQERKRGLSLKKDYTSEDILQRISADTNEKAASQLREIYIRARYDETHEVDRAQVEAAKAALKNSRG